MNKIYKLIWSKVKNMWVVASELAKSHTKSPNSGIVGSVSLASLESKINTDLSKGFVAGVFPMATLPAVKSSSFTITVAAIVKNEAENVPTWVQAARSCADEIVVVDTGSTDDTVKCFADYGIKCFHYDWHDDFASAKNYMISLCHGDWIVLLDGDEWFREGCDVRKAIAKHHNNPITKAIIADWICLDSSRNNMIMFSGGAVRAFRNSSEIRYFRKVHENLTIQYENFVFEPEFKMYHTGYSGDVNRSKHERNLRIMRTMFDFDNGKVEYPTDWRYIEDTYAGLGQFDKALWAADKMISYGVQEYSAAAWITKFNVLFAVKTPLEEMKKQFAYCFKTVPSVSGFRFLASVYFFRNGLIAEGLDNYIEGLRMLMGPQDKVAQEHTYWRMYMPEASALASAVYLQNKQVEAALYACKVCEQYCGQTGWTSRALIDVRRVMNQSEESVLGNISERVLPVLQFAKKGVLATALVSSLTVGMVGVANPVFAACCNLNGVATNQTTGDDSTVTGGQCNTANCDYSSVSGGYLNTASGNYSFVSGGRENVASGYASSVFGGCNGFAYACYSTVIGGGIAGNADSFTIALGSVAIGKGAVADENYEIAIGSSDAPVTIGGALTVDGAKTVTDGTTTKSWSDILNASGSSGSFISYVGVNSTGNENKDGSGASGTDAIAIGNGAVASGNQSISIGTGNQVRGNHSGAVGDPSIVDGSDSYVVGNNSTVRANVRNAFVLGNNTTIDNGLPANWDSMSDEEKAAWANGLASTDIMEGAVALGSNISVSLDNKAATSRTSSGDPAIKHVVALGDNVVIGEENAVGIGHTATATALNALAIGDDAQAVAEGANAVGHSSRATNRFANASGYQAQATGEGAGAFGQDAQATANFATAFGRSTRASAESATAIGNTAHAVTQSSIAIGSSAVANGGANTNAVAIGRGAAVGSDIQGYGEAVALGGGSSVQNAFGTALGSGASVIGQNSVALGYGSTAAQSNVVSVGKDAVTGDTPVAEVTRRIVHVADGVDNTDAVNVKQLNDAKTKYFGVNSSDSTGQTNTNVSGAGAIGSDSVAIGKFASACGTCSVAIGICSSVTDVLGVALGAYATAGDAGVAIGGDITSGTFANGASVAIGSGARAEGVTSTALNKAQALGRDAIAVGYEAYVSGDYAIGIGNAATVMYTNGIAIGYNSSASEDSISMGNLADSNDQAVALGMRSYAQGIGSVALGSQSVASDDYVVSLGSDAVTTGNNQHAEINRRIVHLAAGVNDTDAVNVKQLNDQKVEYVGVNAVWDDWSDLTDAQKTSLGVSTEEEYNTLISTGGNINGDGALGVDSIAIGRLAKGNSTYSISIGKSAESNNFSTAIGNNVSAGGQHSVSIGSSSNADGNYTVVLGWNSLSTGANSVAIGKHASAKSYDSVAIGIDSETTADDAVAIGQGATVKGIYGIAIGENTLVKNNDSTAIGSFAQTDGVQTSAFGDNSKALGPFTTAVGASAQALGDYATTIGYSSVSSAYGFAGGYTAEANPMSVAVGYNAKSKGGESIAIGTNSISNGGQTIALGEDTTAGGNGTVAIGYSAKSSSGYNIALGQCAIATTGSNSVALGSNSVVTDSDTVSLGKNAVGTIGQEDYVAEYTRKIQHVTAGVNDTDAVNVKQLHDGLYDKANWDASNIGRNLSMVDDEYPEGLTDEQKVEVLANNREYNLRSWGQALGAGTVTGGDARLVTGDTLHVEVRPAENGTYVKTNNTTGQNLLALDQQLSTVLEGTASQNTAISDLQNEMDTKANVGLDNITDAGKTVVRDLAKESVKVVNGTNTTVTEGTDGNAKTYAVNTVTDGAVADGNTGIVTGGTVYSAIQDMIASSGSSEGKANVALDNVTEAGHTVIKTDAKSAVNVAGNSDVTVTKTDVDGVDTYNVVVVKTGTVSDGNEGIVTGDTVYDALKAEIRPSVDGNYITTGNTAGANLTALDAQVKTNTDAVAAHTTDITNLKDLSNITDAGQTVVQNLAKGSVNVAGSDKATVTKTDVNGVDTYTVSVKNDGLVASGNADLVSGGTVYDALIAETRPAANGNYITTNRTVGANLTALDAQVKTNTDAVAAHTTDITNLKDLSNITDAGQSVFQNLAKGSVNVAGSDKATVTKTDVNGVDTYTVSVKNDGLVASGNADLVSGGTVYDALFAETRPAANGNYIATDRTVGANLTVLDTQVKANTDAIAAHTSDITNLKDLSNITDAGQTVVKNLAKGSVNVVGTNKATVTKTDVNGVDTYTVDVKADGEILAGNKGLVDGGTVFDAVAAATGNIIDYTNDGLAGKANVDLDNVTEAGHTVIKTDAKSAVNVVGGTNAEVVKTDVNGVDTYTVNVAGNGQVAENDTGLVNGGTVYNELRPVDGNYVHKDATTAANLSALDTKIGSVADGTYVRSANTVGQNLNALDEVLHDKANGDASNIGRNLPVADSDYPDGLTDEQKAEYASNLREYNLRSWGQALGAGTVTGGDARLITGDTLHVEVRPANSGTYVRVDKTTGENLLALDEQLSSVVNGASAQSTAINDLENEMANKANIALDNINADGVNVVRNIAKSAVVVADGPNTTVSSSTDTDGNITYRVTANATGSVADGNTGLVDGGMVYTAIENAKGSMGGDIGGLDADGNYIRKANTVAQNLVALDTQVKTNADGLAAEQTVRETADTALSNRIGTLTADGNYIAKDSSVSENLSRLDTAVKTAGDTADANAVAIADLKDLSNITAAGETVIKDLAKGSVKVINGTNTTVTEGMDGDVKTFVVNVVPDGAVADGDTGLVSGGTVKSALDALSGSVDAGLAGKATVSLDNLDADGHMVIKSDAKSAVNVVGSNRATVTKTDVNGVDTYTVDVKADGVILADNKGLVDGGTVFDAVVAATGNIIDYTNDGFAGKANVELDNVTEAGHTMIKTDAKSAVNVTGGQYATVTKTDVDGVDTYMVNVATDGSVTDGNEKLVTGGTVYDALQDIRGSVDTAMAGKANTSLDNLDVAGVGRVRDIAKTAVSVADGAHTTASSETDADGNVIYRVNVDLDGSVASGNNGVVSGGGIYNELRPADGNYVAQSNTTAANLTALDVAVKEAMTKAETAQAVAGGNVVLYDGDDKSAVTLGGTDGTVIHNVADGAVSADSKDAVNGGQLYTVKSAVDANTTAIAGLDTKIQDHATAIAGLDTRVQDNATAIAGLDTRVQDNATAIAGLDTRVQDNATAIDTLRTTVIDGLNGKADTDLGNLSDTGKGTVRGLAKESVRVADGLNTTVRTTVDGNASVYHVDVATTGRVESGNAGIVTGDAVYEALRDLELNASDTHYVSVNPSERDDETYTNHGASGADAVAVGAKSYARGDESVAIGHNNDVSGNETYVIGSDVNATGNHSVVLGKGSDGSLDNVVSVGSAGNERRIVHVADGELSADSKDAVNGKQLYEVREKLQNAEGIDVDKWSDALGTGSVAPGDDRLVKGSTVYSAIQSFSGITLSPDGSTLHVGTNNTATVVDFSNSEGNGRVLQGVVTDPDNPNSAANVGYVNAVGQNIINGVNNSLNRMDSRIDKVGAGAAALASLEPMPFDDDQKWSISAAIGTYHGTQAGAVGVFYKPQDNVMLNIRGAVGNGENMGGAGLSIGLNKGAAKGLSKASMAKAMNAQANEIVAQKQLIQNQQAQLDAQKAEIEELKQMVRSVVASKQAAK